MQTQGRNHMDLKTIDLDQAEKAVSSLVAVSNDQQQQEYQPQTLRSDNRTRENYLPMFPTIAFGLNNQLLLANVPVARLGPHQILRRQHGAYTSDALMLLNNYRYRLVEGFTLSSFDIEELATRLRVGPSILTFNADRLRRHYHVFGALHEYFRKTVLEDNRYVVLKEGPLNSKQMALLLEFYLQIDVDVFYMKTCSFRGALPPSDSEGLFCGRNEPQSRYTLTACGHPTCLCCHPINHERRSQVWPVVDFHSSSMHQFLNGYRTYLNCPATCNTSNIIYTMTCPCGQYDYVDSTAKTLAQALTYHREHGNSIIHEKLVGSRSFRGIELDPEEQKKQIARKMRLYQHSARCPVALRSFLDCNPQYWCFIPVSWQDASNENSTILRQTPPTSPSSTTTTTDPELINIIAMGAIDDPRVFNFLEHVPRAPAAFAFSYRQRQQQRAFFERFISSSTQQLPYSPLDLYQVAIIAVLPNDRSILLRYILETLFIVHGETKLNMICPIGIDPEKRYGRAYNRLWCANFDRPSMPLQQ